MMDHLHVLIMAGGEGTRFAPLSTPERPKQFLHLVGDKMFIRQTFERALLLTSADRIYVATNVRYVDLVREHLPEVPAENIISEPVKKNTAPCILYACRFIQSRDPLAVVAVFPSDHVICHHGRFVEAVELAARIAAHAGKLVTLGITPAWPATEYGYIKASDRMLEGTPLACEVERFVEKPNDEIARRYVAEGGYYWNSGMFIWTASAILAEAAIHLTDLYGLLAEFTADGCFRDRFFDKARSISIDYGILEKSGRTVVIPCDLGWSDVGTWEGLHRLSQGDGVVIAHAAAKVMREQLGFTSAAKAGALPRRVDKPWGAEEIWAHTDDYVGKLLIINAPHRLSYQYHRIKEETIRVLEGVVDVECEKEGQRTIMRLNTGDLLHIPPRARHRFIAVEDCRILEVSTPYLGDVVRIEDDYGRHE